MGQSKSKRIVFMAICFVLLFIPLIGLSENIRCLLSSILPNSEFWFGYMAYFGTVALAIVAVWQTGTANELSNKLLNLELKSKMGYFDPQGIAQYEGHCWEEVILHNVGDDIAKIDKIHFLIRDASGNVRYETDLLDHTKRTVFIDKKTYISIPNEHKIEGDIERRQVYMIVYIENSRGYQYKQVIDMIWNKGRDAVHSSTKIMELDEPLM